MTLKAVAPIILLSLVLAGCDEFETKPSHEDPYKNFQLEVSKVQLEGQKLDQQLRLKIADICVGKGMIPVFMSGNVDCKAVK